MPSLQLYRRRIRSITSTRQITKAMELVAASKLSRAQQQALKLRDYAGTNEQFVELLAGVVDPKTHPMLAIRPVTSQLVVVVTSDRGLAGAYNSQLLRKLVDFEAQHKGVTTSYLTIGKKGQDFLNRTGKNIVATFTKFPPHPTALDVRPIAKLASDGFLTNQYQAIHIAHTQFVSAIKQTPQMIQLLPIESPKNQPTGLATYGVEYRFEPNRDEVLEFILPRAIEVILYQAILESIASEHSSRMIAMKNASDNAKELIDDLTLSYNSIRQEKITQELAEIATASEAIS